jgi:hypothetical protein
VDVTFEQVVPFMTEMGSAGAVILVVIFFLRHLKDRDAAMNAVLRDLTVALNDALSMLKHRQ